jgi:hypothetical protein
MLRDLGLFLLPTDVILDVVISLGQHVIEFSAVREEEATNSIDPPHNVAVCVTEVVCRTAKVGGAPQQVEE